MKTKKRFFLLGGLLILVIAGITALFVYKTYFEDGYHEWPLTDKAASLQRTIQNGDFLDLIYNCYTDSGEITLALRSETEDTKVLVEIQSQRNYKCLGYQSVVLSPDEDTNVTFQNLETYPSGYTFFLANIGDHGDTIHCKLFGWEDETVAGDDKTFFVDASEFVPSALWEGKYLEETRSSTDQLRAVHNLGNESLPIAQMVKSGETLRSAENYCINSDIVLTLRAEEEETPITVELYNTAGKLKSRKKKTLSVGEDTTFTFDFEKERLNSNDIHYINYINESDHDVTVSGTLSSWQATREYFDLELEPHSLEEYIEANGISFGGDDKYFHEAEPVYSTQSGQLQVKLKASEQPADVTVKLYWARYHVDDVLLEEQTQTLSTDEETTFTFSDLSEHKRYFLTYSNESDHDETFVGEVTN